MKNLYVLLMFLLIGACSSAQVKENDDILISDNEYVDDASRYRQNIAIKDKGDTFVTYEYKDVRIDELAPLAIKYCEKNASNKYAHLREIVLYRNHLRRATFDCLSLAMEK